MDFERQQFTPPATRKSSFQTKVLLGSVLAHGLIGWWLLSQHRINVPPKVEEQFTPIKAKLVFFPPPKVIDESPADDVLEQAPPPAIKEEQQEVNQPIEEVEVVEEVEAVESKIPEAPQQEIEQPIPTPEIVETSEPESPQNDSDSMRNDLPQIDFPDTQERDQTSDSSAIKPQTLAQKHLQNYSTQANQRLAEQEAQLYRQQRKSPNLSAPKFDPFQTEDEKLRESNSVRVDCSSTVNKTIAVISTITGGTLDCSKSQDFESYIDKHVKKPVPAKDKR